MKNVGKLFDTEHQQCIVHGLHLAVIDVLYKKQPGDDSEENVEGSADDAVEEILEDENESCMMKMTMLSLMS